MRNYINLTIAISLLTSAVVLASDTGSGDEDDKGGNPQAKISMPNPSHADAPIMSKGLHNKKDQEVLNAKIQAHANKQMREEEAKRKAEKEKLDVDMAALNLRRFKFEVRQLGI